MFPVQVLGYGPAAVAATASLIGALAADGSPDIVRALLQRDAAVLLTQMLQYPPKVAGAREADVATLQCKGMVRLPTKPAPRLLRHCGSCCRQGCQAAQHGRPGGGGGGGKAVLLSTTAVLAWCRTNNQGCSS